MCNCSLVQDGAQTGLSEDAPFLSLQAPNLGENVNRYRGTPGMWSLAPGMLELAAQDRLRLKQWH